MGITQQYNSYESWVMHTAEKEGYYVLDNYVPVSRETFNKMFGVGYAYYTVAVQKKVQVSFDDPLFRAVKHDLTVDQQSGMLSIRLPLP